MDRALSFCILSKQRLDITAQRHQTSCITVRRLRLRRRLHVEGELVAVKVATTAMLLLVTVEPIAELEVIADTPEAPVVGVPVTWGASGKVVSPLEPFMTVETPEMPVAGV